MSDNKYYTPSIEELIQVGFEFESCSHGQNDWKKRVMDKERLEMAVKLYYHNNLEKIVRVKYLDREDVESLGWNKSLNNDKTCYKDIIFKGGKKIAWILVEPSNHHCLIYTSGVNQPCTEGDTIFTGTIKNKSQLKHILQWTGILK